MLKQKHVENWFARRAIGRIAVQPSLKKYFACPVGQITSTSFCRPALDKEGRFAVVTNVGCGMRWTRRRRKTGGAFADGEVVWSWRPDAGAKVVERSANDGGKRARSPGRARNKP